MGEKSELEKKCLEMLLEFFRDVESVKILDIIMDIYDQIKYNEINRDAIEKKFMKVLYNLRTSKTFDSLLDEEDRKLLSSFLGDFLEIKPDCHAYHIGNKYFSKLSLQQFFSLLMEVKYLKIRELSQRGAVN